MTATATQLTIAIDAGTDRPGVVHFASGSNHFGEQRALAELGVPIGTVADRVSVLVEDELDRLADTGHRVFIDSGAFSEVSFPGGVPTITKPIDDATWRRILATYKTMALTLGSQVCCVAPDCVAHQELTLERLERYADDVREIAELGAQVLVAIQGGKLDGVTFCRRVESILGDVDWTPAIPMMKGETPLDALESFVRWYRPARVHLLGIGSQAKDDRYAKALEAIRRGCPTTTVQSDSALIPRLSGKTNGPGGGPRVLTRHFDQVRDEMNELEVWGGCYDAGSMGVADYTDEIAFPDGWLVGKNRKAVIAELEAIGYEPPRSPRRSMTDWLDETDALVDDPAVEAIFDAAWQRFFDQDGCVAERKRRSVTAALVELGY